MKLKNHLKIPNYNKVISYVSLFAFCVFWVITLLVSGMSKTLKKHSPRSHFYYNLAIRQNWHLFSNPSIYNKQVIIVLRQKYNLNKCDTFNITQYYIEKRKQYAPFNNYYDNIDHILFRTSYYVESSNIEQVNLLKKQDSTKQNFWYIKQASAITSTKKPINGHYNNLANLCKEVLINENINIKNTEYQLLIKNNYVPPYILTKKEYDVDQEIVVPCFITPFFSF